MINIILGNITSLISNLLDAFSATRSNKKDMLKIQCLSVIVYIITNTLLKAYSTVVQNICGLIRNILAVKDVDNKIIQYIIIASALVFGVYFNNLGLIGLLPVFGNVEYSICLFVLKDNVRGLKLSFLISNVCFVILNLYVSNFVGVVFTSIIVVTTFIELIKPILNNKD